MPIVLRIMVSTPVFETENIGSNPIGRLKILNNYGKSKNIAIFLHLYRNVVILPFFGLVSII
jgi:hypothetical protein